MTEVIVLNNQTNNELILFTQKFIADTQITIDIEFVKKFMFVVESKEEFPVSINLLVDWKVDSRKDHAKDRLLKYFVENSDYVVKKITNKIRPKLAPEHSGAKKEKRGGHNQEEIYATLNEQRAIKKQKTIDAKNNEVQNPIV